MLYHFVSQIAPPVPNWIMEWFAQTPQEKVAFWFHVGLIIAVLIGAYILTGFERRFGTTLTLTFASWWVLYKPASAGLLSLNLPENPLIKDGLFTFLGTPDGFSLFLQLIVGIMIVVPFIRYLIQAFIIYPLKYNIRQHEGSQYQKQTAKKQHQLKQKQLKQQRKQIGKQRPQRQKKQTPPAPTQPIEPAEPTAYTDERGNEQDIDFYL